MKFATKPIGHYPRHLRHVATLPWEINNSDFLLIFSRYGKNANKLHFNRLKPVSYTHLTLPTNREV